MRNYLFAALVLLACVRCNKWDDHNAITDAAVTKNLFQQIQEDAGLSKFAELLVKSGYDKVIASSQNYTVFVPTNEALAILDPGIVADEATLRLFVGNHITNQLQQVAAGTALRLRMHNGKYNNVNGMNIGGATITAANKYGKNGLLHIINAMLPAHPSAWEFVESHAAMPAHQKSFMLQTDSLGPYLRNEEKQFTFFVVADDAWDAEVNRYLPYFKTGTTDSTATLAAHAVVSDFLCDTVYDPASIPDTVFSLFHTKLGIDKNAIVQTLPLSNGIVYIMSKLEVLPAHKFKPIIIQGEDYQFSRVDRRNVTYLRDKLSPATNQVFRDVLVFNHDVAQFYLGYNLYNIPSIKYKASWVAVHDHINNNTGAFRQMLGIGTFAAPALPYTTVQPNNYDEVALGEFELPAYHPLLNIFLTADNSTNDDANKITVDYIKLEPVF